MNAPLQRHALQPQRLSIQGNGVRLQAYLWDKAGVPTLLLVHGYPDNHEIWQPLIRELAADYRIVAYDVRGCGASAAPQHLRDYRLERLARDLEAVLLATSAVSYTQRDVYKRQRPKAMTSMTSTGRSAPNGQVDAAPRQIETLKFKV